MILKYEEEMGVYNQLRSGEPLEVKSNAKWKKAIRLGTNWYFIDVDGFTCRCKKLEGLEVEEIW